MYIRYIQLERRAEVQIERIPLYKQIQQYFLDNIQEGRWKPDEKIPSENELSEQFNVSRITVKKALDDLVDSGIIYRIQGKGSFLSNNKSFEPIIYENKSAAKNKNKLVAVIMPRVEASFNTSLLSQIEQTLTAQGYRIIFCQTRDSQRLEEQTIKDLLEIGVQGIIIYPVEGETYNEEVLRLSLEGFPLVLIDRYFRGIDANSVCSDNFAGAYEATKYLLEQGHTRIGIISTKDQGTTSIEDRILGYEKALTDFHIPIDHRLYSLNLGIMEDNENKLKIQDFIKTNPDITAVFAISNGLSVLTAAQEIGLKVPDDLSIIMFDDYDYAEFFNPAPSCVKQQEKLIAEDAAKLLITAIENPHVKRQKIQIPTQLNIRQTTAKR